MNVEAHGPLYVPGDKKSHYGFVALGLIGEQLSICLDIYG